MQILEFLNGISPWYWVAFALALGVLEMATFSFFLIWPALASLIVAILLAASPTLSPAIQISIFAVASIGLTIAGRAFFQRYGDGGGNEDQLLNNRGQRIIGRAGVVTDFSNGAGYIEVEGMRWRAQWPKGQDAKSGDQVRVTHADGMMLGVENIIG
jgi:membrane protein implicated in regulation of membrane protease activity